MLLRIQTGLCGTLSDDVQQRIRQLKFDQFQGRAEAILDFHSLKELRNWLNTKFDWFLSQSQYEPTNGDLIDLRTSRRLQGMPFDVPYAWLQHPIGRIFWGNSESSRSYRSPRRTTPREILRRENRGI